MPTYPSRHISVAIACAPTDVIAFLSDVLNWPKWASGLYRTFSFVGDGEIRIGMLNDPMIARLTGASTVGIFDHIAKAADGRSFYNPLRVIPNGDGSEVVFTLYRMPDTDDATFEKDAAWVARDLATLKGILEAGAL